MLEIFSGLEQLCQVSLEFLLLDQTKIIQFSHAASILDWTQF